jgi:ketosteroid isomerase-like protein
MSAPAMPTIDELRRLGQAWNQAWNSRDPSALVAFFAPGSTFSDPTLAGPMDGADGITAAATRTWSEWPHAVFDVISITVEAPAGASRVVVEWRTTEAHRSGLEHVLEGVDILEVVDGRVAACRSYHDTRTRFRRAP